MSAPGISDYDIVVTDVDSKTKKEVKDQVSIQSSTTPDPGYKWERENFTIRHHKRQQRGQLFPSR